MKKLALVFVVLVAGVSVYGQKSEVLVTEKGAANGYDVVAYFTEGKPVEGTSAFRFDWKGQVWLFSSQDNLNAFKAEPEKYMPQFGGYCAFGMSRGYKAPTQPDAWTIVNGKLYLNYNVSVRDEWNKNREDRIRKAEENWPKVKDQEN